jgi:argininosuccinate lyase
MNKKTNSMWGGRFESAPDAIMDAINVSIDVDKRMYAQDIAGSRAHCRMLATQGIIPAADAQAILKGLDQIEAEMDAGTFVFSRAHEDIHMNIEARLTEIIGPAAGRLHTARSRNDQVATTFRLWVRDAIDDLTARIEKLEGVLSAQSTTHKHTIMPGFTHLQVAQPVTFGLHLDAYVQMLTRDKARLADARARANESPLGAAALAGTSYPIDRAATAQAMGFARPMPNTMDAVGARDFAIEVLSACAICGMHLSRLAEELVLWTTPQFNFVRLSDGYSTGSSIMPQKRNPDAAELVRAKTGRLNGNLQGLLTVMKGLPLTYNKDMQEDKPYVFDSVDTLALCLEATAGMIAGMTVNVDTMQNAAESGYATATELADWLVQTLGVPFRDAHHIVGRTVKLAESKGVRLDGLTLDELQTIDARITDDARKVLSASVALKRRGLI